MLAAALVFAAGCAPPEPLDIALVEDGDGWAVAVRGGGDGSLQVFVGSDTVDRSPVLGSSSTRAGTLHWTPQFPLDPGREYTAVWQNDETLERVSLRVPAPPASHVAEIVEIFPTTAEVPENLLRVYIDFSRPMSVGFAADHIELLDRSGEVIEGAFVVPETELWSPDRTRLTVFFDPGRVKQDVGPNLAMGAPLRADETVVLRVRAGWPDGTGQPIALGRDRVWSVDRADRTQPGVGTWRVHEPLSGTGDLVVDFPEALDSGLLRRMLTVEDADGDEIKGQITLGAGENRWHFMPAAPWVPGSYAIRVDANLEDLAGNSLERLFDEPLREEVGRPSLADVLIPFEVPGTDGTSRRP